MANETITTTLGDIATKSRANANDLADTAEKISAKAIPSSTPKLVLTKTVTASDGYYYKIKPQVQIVSQSPSRYTVKSKDEVKTSKGLLTSVTFDIYFLFTNTDVKRYNGDSIEIDSSPVKIPVRVEEVINKVVLDGPPLSTSPVSKTLKVYGDPGTYVEVFIKNSAGQYFNFAKTWTSSPISRTIRIPTEEDFPGELPGEYAAGVWYEDFVFPSSNGITTVTPTAVPIKGSELSAAKNRDIIVDQKMEVAEETSPGVYLTIGGTETGDLGRTFSADLKLGPFVPGQEVEIPVLQTDALDPEQQTSYIITVTRTSGSGAFDVIAHPDFGTHWSNTNSDENGGWEFEFTTRGWGDATTYYYQVDGRITKIGRSSLTTLFDASKTLDFVP